MSLRQSIEGLGGFRRAVVMTPLTIAFCAVLIWTLAHADIAAFATVFVAGIVVVFGMFWATRPITSRDISNPSHPPGRILRLWHRGPRSPPALVSRK